MFQSSPFRRMAVALTALTATVSLNTFAAGADLPDLSLVGLDGKTVHLSDLVDDRPSVLIFWATWCRYCKAEIPKISQAERRYDDRLAVVAIDPGIRDSLANMRLYADHFDLSYPVYFDAGQLSRDAFDLEGTPTVILFDRDGHEVSRSETVDLEAIAALVASSAGQSSE